jgi:dipeptidyl aminopeptidase/acylaminoacyl peptidase
MMAFQMLTRTDIFKAAVTVGAPTMFHTLPSEDYIFKRMSEFLPKGADLKVEAEKRSVIAWAEKLCKTTPLLVLHGTGDRRVAPEHALHIGLALQKIHHPYKLVMFENADHILSGRRKEGDAEIRVWVDAYVKNLAPLPKTGPHGA